MESLEEALTRSLVSKAIALTDQWDDFTAERQGRWVSIISEDHRKHCVRYHGFNSIADVDQQFLSLGWIPVKAGTPLEHLANA